MTTRTPRLPHPAEVQSPENHRAMALRFLAHAEVELAKGHRLQASEKAWGAVAQQLKAIAEQRGWHHDGHVNFYDIASYLAKERGDDQLLHDVASLDQAQHRNFYKNTLLNRDIAVGIRNAKVLVAKLEEIRHQPPRPYKIEGKDDRRLVHRLSGDWHPEGSTSTTSFTNEAWLEERRRKWGVPRRDENEGTGPAEPRQPLPTPSAPSAAIPMPAPEDTSRVTPPAGEVNPMTDLDTGAGIFLETPIPPRNVFGVQPSVAPTERARTVKPPQPKKHGSRAGYQRFPSGHRDRRR